MNGDEIRKMFLLAAQAKKLSEADPRRLEAESVLSQLKERYFAENIEESGQPTETVPDWMLALNYVGGLFSQLDALEPDGANQRKVYWKEISTGVSGWNKKLAEANETKSEE